MKVLCAAALVLLARIVVDGASVTIALTTVVLVLLLGASLALRNHGRHIQRECPRQNLNDSQPKPTVDGVK
jgi:hypothetical protein